MGSDPKPHNRVALADPNGAITERNTCGENRFSGVDLAKPETRMVWIEFEELVSVASALLDLCWKARESSPKPRGCVRDHNLSGSRSCV